MTTQEAKKAGRAAGLADRKAGRGRLVVYPDKASFEVREAYRDGYIAGYEEGTRV